MLYYKIFTLHIDPACHTDYLFCNLSCSTEVWYNALMQGYGKCRHLQRGFMKIISGIGEQTSCRQILGYLFILPVACVYIIEECATFKETKKSGAEQKFTVIIHKKTGSLCSFL